MPESIARRLEMGQFYRENLVKVLDEAGLDLAALIQKGCLCCDVETGAEIAALLPLG